MSRREFRRERIAASCADSDQMTLLGSDNDPAHVRYLGALCGDAIESSSEARRMASERGANGFDLIYLDPPFNTDQEYSFKPRDSAGASGIEVRAFSDRWGTGDGDYMRMLTPRLEAAVDALSPTGWLAVHVDWKADYLVRTALNQIFGSPDCWRNNIYWRRDPGGKGNKARTPQFPRNADTILLYNRATTGWFFQLPRVNLTPEQAAAYRLVDDNGRKFKAVDARNYSAKKIAEFDEAGLIYRSSTGKAYKKYFLDEASSVIDMLWTDIPGFGVRTASAEMTGYPTQKPLALLDRLVSALCPPGGLVGDFFCGSGTTAVSALRNGCDAIVADVSPLALELTIERARSNCGPVEVDFVELPSAARKAPLPLHVAGRATLGRDTFSVTDIRIDLSHAASGEGGSALSRGSDGGNAQVQLPNDVAPESLIRQLHIRATSGDRVQRLSPTRVAGEVPKVITATLTSEFESLELIAIDLVGEQHVAALEPLL